MNSQERSLATLGVGRGAAFSDGDDAPITRTGSQGKDWGTRHTLQRRSSSPHVVARRAGGSIFTFLLPSFDCGPVCALDPAACEAARNIVADGRFRQTFARTVVSTVEDSAAYDRLLPDLSLVIARLRQPWINPGALMLPLAVHAAREFAGRVGARAGSTYAQAEELDQALHSVLIIEGNSGTDVREGFRLVAMRLLSHGLGPFPACPRLWQDDNYPCRCRVVVAELVASGELRKAWDQADVADAASAYGRRERSWAVCQDAAYQLIEFPEDDWPAEVRERVAGAARRVAICFGQQMMFDSRSRHPRTLRRAMHRLMREAGLE